MKIRSIYLQNYRTAEKLEINFNDNYSSISGTNNAGKSNIIRALRVLFNYDDRVLFFSSRTQLNFKADYPRWKKSKDSESIIISAKFIVDSVEDSLIYKFIETIAFKDYVNSFPKTTDLNITAELKNKEEEVNFKITFANQQITDKYIINEIITKLKFSDGLICHTSFEHTIPSDFRRKSYYDVSMLSKENKEKVLKIRDKLIKSLKAPIKEHQKEIAQVIGKLNERYEVHLSPPELGLERLNLQIDLGDKDIDVSLDDWGNGTRNRTLILMSLINAKRASAISNESERVKPIVVIEEPESYLHPSAQAQFGRLLQDLSGELDIQIIVITHCPLMLSQKKPASNILLERKIVKKFIRETYLVDTTGENWFIPFNKAIGYGEKDIAPYKEIMFSSKKRVILVEGPLDVEYLRYLQQDKHGNNKLVFEGDIFPVFGFDNFCNSGIINLIKNKYDQFIILADLDRYAKEKEKLNRNGFQANVNLILVGLSENGKKTIEGLLPSKITTEVHTNNNDLLMCVTNNNDSESQRQAKEKLKKLYLDALLKSQSVSSSDLTHLFNLVKSIKRTLMVK